MTLGQSTVETFDSVYVCVHTRLCLLTHVLLFNPMDYSPWAPLSMEIFQEKNAGVGCHFSPPFSTQELNPCLLYLLRQTDPLLPGKPDSPCGPYL